ncbi:CinA family protein [Limnobacter parvus]|uniref:CinA family protein n=1 Tax=Limnobacter parvus TaxID=2939690 RepID=A0ABT1XGV4_9BURK|nr:CinA family protein [Limnobacter parvus]MCR2746384.1 CinA family protein [Limnobacter parvus]
MSNSNQALLIQIAESFTSAGAKLGVVESCTGGGLGAALTSIAGSSEWFEGGLITYSNKVKMKSVYVRESTLDQHGAVSEECVKEMANGGMIALGLDCCLSVSGIAGPGGGSPGKPVGTVWFGLAVRHKSIEAFHHVFEGDRNSVREQAVQVGLSILSKVSLKKAV